MKNIKVQKLIKMVALAFTINVSVLTTIACSKRSDDNIIDKNRDEIDENSLEFKTLVNESKLITKSLLISRYKEWNPDNVLADVLERKNINLDNYFDSIAIKEKFLTSKYQNFTKPNYKIDKPGFELSIIKSLLVTITNSESKLAIVNQLKSILGIAGSMTGSIKAALEPVKEIIINLNKVLKDKINIKTYDELFKDIKAVDGDLKNEIAKLMPNLPVFLSFLNEIINNFAENTNNKVFNLEDFLKIKYQDFKNIKLSKLLNNLRDIADTKQKKDKLLSFLEVSDFPFKKEITNLVNTVFDNICEFDKISSPDLVNKVDQTIEQFLGLLNILATDLEANSFEFNNFINKLGINVKEAKEDKIIAKNSFLDYLISLLEVQWGKNIIIFILEQDAIWKLDGDYKKDMIKTDNYVDIEEVEFEKNLDNKTIIVTQHVKAKGRLAGNDQKLIVKWKMTYDNTNKFDNMKIISFD